MKIVNILPIHPGVLKETLTYYTAKDVSQNALVVVSLRGKTLPALVVSCEEVTDAKSRLRSSSFSLKRVEHVAEKNFMLPEFILAAFETSHYFAGSVGGVIAGLLPQNILEEYLKPKGDFVALAKKEHPQTKKEVPPENLQNIEKYAVQAANDDRFSVYRGIIREEFAKGASVFLAAPTTVSAGTIHRELGRGIEQYAFLLHGKLSQKEIATRWKTAVETDHPILIVATPSFVGIPRADFGAFILEEESRDSYQSFSRPYFDLRFFLESYADKMRAKFIVGDLFLRIETLYRYEQKNLSSIIPLRFRMLSGLDQKIVDMKKEKEEASRAEGFHIISKELTLHVSETLLSKGNVLLFGVRRGLASLTICRDCGTVLTCKRCNIPYVLHSEKNRNIFICHKCEERKKTEILCGTCGGWRLTALGGGVEATATEAKMLFPETEVIEFHADSIKTDKQRTEVAEKIKNSRSSIIVGTEMCLPYVPKASLCGIVSVDTLFSLPDFRIREKTLRKLLEVKARAEKTFIVQTRYPEEKLFRSLIQGNLLEFYKDEIEERKQFAYSPFSTMIKIHFDGTDSEIADKADLIEKQFKDFNVKIFPAFIPKIKDRYQVNAVIKIPVDKWPLNGLVQRLVSLPPYFRVKVDPEDLL